MHCLTKLILFPYISVIHFGGFFKHIVRPDISLGVCTRDIILLKYETFVQLCKFPNIKVTKSYSMFSCWEFDRNYRFLHNMFPPFLLTLFPLYVKYLQ